MTRFVQLMRRDLIMSKNENVVSLPRALDEVEFCSWMGQAAPGEVREYHRGYLVHDIMPYGRQPNDGAHLELRRVARRAMWAAEHGLVHLVQRRHGCDDYSYLAIARPKPSHPPASLSALLLEEAA